MPALGRQENHLKYKASLGYLRSQLKKPKVMRERKVMRKNSSKGKKKKKALRIKGLIPTYIAFSFTGISIFTYLPSLGDAEGTEVIKQG